jgi:hypothetical protein
LKPQRQRWLRQMPQQKKASQLKRHAFEQVGANNRNNRKRS